MNTRTLQIDFCDNIYRKMLLSCSWKGHIHKRYAWSRISSKSPNEIVCRRAIDRMTHAIRKHYKLSQMLLIDINKLQQQYFWMNKKKKENHFSLLLDAWRTNDIIIIINWIEREKKHVRIKYISESHLIFRIILPKFVSSLLLWNTPLQSILEKKNNKTRIMSII